MTIQLSPRKFRATKKRVMYQAVLHPQQVTMMRFPMMIGGHEISLMAFDIMAKAGHKFKDRDTRPIHVRILA
jgi:hypothetical protein